MNFSDSTIRKLFGNEAAEDENIERLKQYYVKSATYESMYSDLPLLILVGHKGTGKSALLSVLEAEQESNGVIVIKIQPDDILGLKNDEESFLELIRAWKMGLSNIIFQKMMISLNAISEKNTWAKKVCSLAMSLLSTTVSNWENEKIGDKNFVRLLKDSLFSNKKITVLIDDLDRGWKNTSADISRISALLNAVRDISRDVKNVSFRIALRSDVYYAVRTSDESTDKIEGSVTWLKWSNHEILVMLIKRIETARGKSVDEESLIQKHQSELQQYLTGIFDTRFQGSGYWKNAPTYRVLMSLVRKRPRDLIKLCTMSAKKAYENKHDIITTEDLESVFIDYSSGRLQDTVNEYSSEFPQIEELLLKMKPSRRELDSGHPCLYSYSELSTKLSNIMSQSHFCFANNKIKVTPKSLAAFLYKINFLTARRDNEGKSINRIYYDENRYVLNDFTEFGYMYEIHPAYRWALQPSDIERIFSQIALLD